jgi:hypothetical protein
MNKNSTLVAKCIITLTIFSLLSLSTNAQITPKLKFKNPVLVAGTAGAIGATYKFANVTTNIDAYVTIEDIVNGAVLKNIDESSIGYTDAWQPTVGGPGTSGSSYIKWDVKFDSAGSPHTFSTLYASAIDVDGDNSMVQEFIGVNGQSSYTLPTQIPSMLILTTSKDTDNVVGTDLSDSNLVALGPVTNRNGIDTLSQDVRINFNFTNSSEFKIYTGSQVDNNGSTAGMATDRYHCIYFADITGTYSVLPVTYESFNATLNNNKIRLNWTTSAEIANDQFEVERSFDQSNFSTAALVLGAQSQQNGLNEYSFTDGSKDILNHATLYYRLKQTDASGHITYSAVKMVCISHAVPSQVLVATMPNPYVDKVNINFTSPAAGKAEVSMTNVTGSVIKKTTTEVNKGSNIVSLNDLSSQLPGMYIITITVNGQYAGSQKLIKN